MNTNRTPSDLADPPQPPGPVLPRHRVPAHLARRFHQICLGVSAEILDPEDLNPIEYALLAAVDDNPGIDQRGLGGRLGIDPASTSQMVDRLGQARTARADHPSGRPARPPAHRHAGWNPAARQAAPGTARGAGQGARCALARGPGNPARPARPGGGGQRQLCAPRQWPPQAQARHRSPATRHGSTHRNQHDLSTWSPAPAHGCRRRAPDRRARASAPSRSVSPRSAHPSSCSMAWISRSSAISARHWRRNGI